MRMEDALDEIEHLQKEIDELRDIPSPENNAHLKTAEVRLNLNLNQWHTTLGIAQRFMTLYRPNQGEMRKLVDGLKNAKGFFERRRKANKIVAIARDGLVIAENTIREGGVNYSEMNELVEGHRTMLQEAENLRESLGLLGIVVKISKALFRDAQRLLSRRRIRKPPGTRWLQFTEFFFSPKTVEGTFRPIAADWQYEHFDALNKGRNFKARWIWVRYNYAFVKTVGLSNLLSFIKWVVSIFKG